jgi:hypothetical protein
VDEASVDEALSDGEYQWTTADCRRMIDEIPEIIRRFPDEEELGHILVAFAIDPRDFGYSTIRQWLLCVREYQRGHAEEGLPGA